MRLFSSLAPPSSQQREAQLDASIKKKINEAAIVDSQRVKFLLLGSGGAGKTTLRKQLQALYGNAFATEEQRKEFCSIIASNIIEGIRAILAALADLNVPLSSEAARAAAMQVNQLVTSSSVAIVLTPPLVEALLTLSRDEGFQKCILMAAKFQLQECVPVFLTKLQAYPAWGGPTWVPSRDDCIRARVRTCGVVQADFKVDGINMSIFDAGGQRAERRKWIHHFDDVTALIFLASLADFDEVLYEDASKNRLQDSLEVFANLQQVHNWNSQILFLNKLDVFRTKYVDREIPLNVSGLFPTAPLGPPSEAEGIAWMISQYRQCMLTAPARDALYCHAISAIDSGCIDALFKDAKHTILKRALAGFC